MRFEGVRFRIRCSLLSSLENVINRLPLRSFSSEKSSKTSKTIRSRNSSNDMYGPFAQSESTNAFYLFSLIAFIRLKE